MRANEGEKEEGEGGGGWGHINITRDAIFYIFQFFLNVRDRKQRKWKGGNQNYKEGKK